MRSVALNSIIVCTATLFSLFTAEIGIRFYTFLSEASDIEDLQKQRVVPGRKHHSTLAEIIQPAAQRGIVYELRPDLNTRFLEVPLKTNQHGFRSPPVQKSKSDNSFRLLGLGDSVMFGWGVPARASYLGRTRLLLSRQFPECDIEIINTAVPGYNGVMAATTLKTKGLTFHPDLVVLGVVQNDLDLPNFIKSGPDYLSVRELFLTRYFKEGLEQITLVNAPLSTTGDGFQSDPLRVPNKYKHMVGAEAYIHAIGAMKQKLLEKQIPWLAINHLELNLEFRSIFDQLGKEVIEVKSNWLEHAKRNNLSPSDASGQLNPGRDPHPSAQLHRVVADTLYSAILSDKTLLKKLQACGVSKRQYLNN
jgi:hypothetical protein